MELEVLNINLAFTIFVALLTGLAFLYRLQSPHLIQSPPSKAAPNTNTSADTLRTHEETSTVSKESEFPADWLTGQTIFDLERRAIFSKTWLPLSHTTHFPAPGSYQSLTIAGFPLLLIRDKPKRIPNGTGNKVQEKEGSSTIKIHTFHNVCRHRAYPVVARKEFGSSTVLGCRYHGWSYNTRGELVKAPQFEGVPGFEKRENGLFAVRTWVHGPSGVVFGNLHGDGDGGGVACDLDVNPRRLRSSLRLGQQRSHSPIQSVLSYLQRIPKSSSSYVFPNTFLCTIPNSRCWLSLRFLPISEGRTSIRYDLYSYSNGVTKTKDHATQDLLASLTTKLRGTVAELEAEFESYTTAGEPESTSISSTLNPESTEIQTRILDHLKAHAKLEKSHSAEIYPARSEPRMNTRYELAEQLCKELDCGGGGGDGSVRGSLDW
ncbi:putative iron-sulfur cluster-binding protein [Aspergillus lucknowensis]|uniref:Rieske [2Fe-2S] iron-sulfur domain-containing protein n=1 Tax=Aspergillus lucknowensis TaxID=176173 RepID=A0ABR4M458_9EURO